MQFTLYVPGNSWMHRLDPVSKVLLTAVGLALTFVLPGHLAPALLLAAALAILATARVLRRSGAVFAGVLLIAVTFFIVQGLVYAGNATPALTLGLRLTFRLYNILASSLILILTTRPSDLVESLMRRGLPSRFGYIIIAVLQVIPVMVEAAGRITDAQRSTSMETEGSLWVRLRAFIPLMGPPGHLLPHRHGGAGPGPGGAGLRLQPEADVPRRRGSGYAWPCASPPWPRWRWASQGG